PGPVPTVLIAIRVEALVLKVSLRVRRIDGQPNGHGSRSPDVRQHMGIDRANLLGPQQACGYGCSRAAVVMDLVFIKGSREGGAFQVEMWPEFLMPGVPEVTPDIPDQFGPYLRPVPVGRK